MLKSLLFASAMGGALAQNDFLAIWYQQAGCPNTDPNGVTHRTQVLAVAGGCQRVPDTPGASYQVVCNAQDTGGTFQTYTDANCAQAQGDPAPFDNNQCLANPPQFGAASVAFTCNAPAAPLLAPADGDFVANWNGNAACAAGAPQSIVLGRQGVCQLVPGVGNGGGGGNTGYMVSCFNNGTQGSFLTFNEATCATINTVTNFTSSQCLANPPNTGSASVSFLCTPPAGSRGNGTVPVLSPDSTSVTWYQSGGCNGDFRTTTFPTRNVCQATPDRASKSYIVTCNANNTGGSINTCSDGACGGNCTTVTFANDQCLANPAQFGASAVRVSCNPSAADTTVTPGPGSVGTRWFASQTCSGAQAVTVAPENQCLPIPTADGATVGVNGTNYIVSCNSQGTGGLARLCSANCTTCSQPLPFSNAQCAADANLAPGRSAEFICGVGSSNGTSGSLAVTVTGAAVALTSLAAWMLA